MGRWRSCGGEAHVNGSREKGPGGYSLRLVLQQCFLIIYVPFATLDL